MTKRLTYEFVKEQFEEEGYRLLSEEYVNSHSKLKYSCPNNHIHSVSFAKWQVGRRCPYCSGKAKKTIDFIRQKFRKEDYELLSKSYKNKKFKLKYRCPKGHIHTVSWDGWRKGDRCPHCSGLIRKEFNGVKYLFENEGYTLLSDQYVNAHSKLKCKCPQGHVYKVTWNNWHNGRRCPLCEDKNFSLRFSGKNSWHWKNYSEADRKKINVYKHCVWRITEFNYKKYKYIINSLNLKRTRGEYHLDHIYSIIDGFNNDVPPEIISHPNNLQMLLEYDNLSKNNKSDISLEELYNRYSYWEAENVL